MWIPHNDANAARRARGADGGLVVVVVLENKKRASLSCGRVSSLPLYFRSGLWADLEICTSSRCQRGI